MMPSWSAGSASGGGDLRGLLIAGRAERDPAGLALLADRDGQSQHTVAQVGRHPACVDVVTQEQLAGELAVGALIDDHFVAVLASRRAATTASTLASSPPTRIGPRAANCGNGLGPSGGSGPAPPAPAGSACPAKPTLPPAVATTGLMQATRTA